MTQQSHFWACIRNRLWFEKIHAPQCSCCCCLPVSLCDPMDCRMPGFPVLHYLLEFALIQVCWVLEAIQPSHPLCLLLLLASVPPNIRVFPKESVLCNRWPKYWSFNFSISPSNEYSELISFKIDWFDLLAVQGTLKSLLQHHSSKASILQHQPSLWSSSHWTIHDYWKDHSLDCTDLCWQSDVFAF